MTTPPPKTQRCAVFERLGQVSAGRLASEGGLSTGAVTTVLDHLERAGLARRVPDPEDRRRVLVEVTPRTRRLTEEIYGPLARAGGRELERYSAAELALLRDFLRRARELQEEHIERVRARLRARQEGDAAS